MDRYTQTFARLKKERALGFCPFAVLGDPDEKGTLARVGAYLQSGADFLELGIPFSDPTADGPVIQKASARALQNGMTPKKAIALIKKISAMVRQAHHDTPIGILTYANIALQYGIDRFYRDIKNAGADSLLLADVPLEEIAPFADSAKKHRLHQIFIVSEHTGPTRLAAIEKIGSGFLYLVSTLGVTGARKIRSRSLSILIKKIKRQTTLPIMVGFGISKPQHVSFLKTTGVEGAIIGSFLVDKSKIDAKMSAQLCIYKTICENHPHRARKMNRSACPAEDSSLALDRQEH